MWKKVHILCSWYSGDEDAAYNFSKVVGVEGVGLASARVSGLRPHSRYSIVLRAFNSKGAGPSSPPALATTLQDSKYFCDFI